MLRSLITPAYNLILPTSTTYLCSTSCKELFVYHNATLGYHDILTPEGSTVLVKPTPTNVPFMADPTRIVIIPAGGEKPQLGVCHACLIGVGILPIYSLIAIRKGDKADFQTGYIFVKEDAERNAALYSHNFDEVEMYGPGPELLAAYVAGVKVWDASSPHTLIPAEGTPDDRPSERRDAVADSHP